MSHKVSQYSHDQNPERLTSNTTFNKYTKDLHIDCLNCQEKCIIKTIDLNVKHTKTIKLLEDNTHENLEDLVFGSELVNIIPKEKSTKEKLLSWT